MTLPTGRDALGTLLSTIRTAAIEPLAAELLSAVRAQRCGLGGNAVMLVRLAGNTTAVHHQRATLAKLASRRAKPDGRKSEETFKVGSIPEEPPSTHYAPLDSGVNAA